MKSNFVKNKLIKVTKDKIILYEDNKLIKEFKEVYIGKNGFTNYKEEGDMCTPLGLFNLGFAFGTKNLNISYPYYQITENSYWVSDSNSKYYNNLVEIKKENKKLLYDYIKVSPKKNWKSSEKLTDYPIQYELALVIEYNMNPIIPNKGSAIFFHIKNKDFTHGCVSTTKENLLYIIKWLNKDTGKILISNN